MKKIIGIIAAAVLIMLGIVWYVGSHSSSTEVEYWRAENMEQNISDKENASSAAEINMDLTE